MKKFNSINVNSLCRHIRYFSSLSSDQRIQPSYLEVTKEEINKLLENQGVSISDEELEKLKRVPGLKFDLPINDQTKGAFGSLIGKPSGLVENQVYTYLPPLEIVMLVQVIIFPED